MVDFCFAISLKLGKLIRDVPYMYMINFWRNSEILSELWPSPRPLSPTLSAALSLSLSLSTALSPSPPSLWTNIWFEHSTSYTRFPNASLSTRCRQRIHRPVEACANFPCQIWIRIYVVGKKWWGKHMNPSTTQKRWRSWFTWPFRVQMPLSKYALRVDVEVKRGLSVIGWWKVSRTISRVP